MDKLDAKFYGTIRKFKDNSVVDPDQWMVFLAKDNAFFPDTLLFYRQKCVDLGADAEQIAAIDRMYERARLWREANKDKLKTPDAAGEPLLDQVSSASARQRTVPRFDDGPETK